MTPQLRILLADDTQYTRVLAKKLYLPMLGRPYELAEATNGLEAEAALNAGGIDFAIMDVNMRPGKTGLELAVMSRALTQGPKVLVWSDDTYSLAPALAQHGLVVVDSRREISQYKAHLPPGNAISFDEIASKGGLIGKQRVVVASKAISAKDFRMVAGYLLASPSAQ